MGHFVIEKFYIYFQGILLFQVLFFGMLFSITKRKEILYYSLYILTNACYFFINAPKTFFNIEDDLVFNTNLYLNVNYLLILIGNLFYLKFLKAIFKNENQDDYLLNRLINYTIYSLPVLLIFFLIFPFFNTPRSAIFYLANIISIPAGLYVIYKNYQFAGGFRSLIIKGIIFNIIGTLLTIIMIIRYNQGTRTYFFDDYPLLYMRLGILADVFFYQLAILRKWYDQEKLLATKDIQNKLDISNLKNQISRELHDDVGSTLSKINLQSFMAQSKLDDNTYDIKSTLSSIQHEAQDLIKRIKNLIWSVDEVTQDFDLITRLSEYGISMSESKNITFKIFNKSSHLAKIDLHKKYNLLMICREAINNAVKYSNAHLLKIEIEDNNNKLVIIIVDNGIGFAISEQKNGLGINNMKQRIKHLNGEININNIDGTEIKLEIPV